MEEYFSISAPTGIGEYAGLSGYAKKTGDKFCVRAVQHYIGSPSYRYNGEMVDSLPKGRGLNHSEWKSIKSDQAVLIWDSESPIWKSVKDLFV